MTAYVGAVVFVLGFAAILAGGKLIARTREVLAASKRSVSIIADKTLSDHEKEKALQKNSLALFAASGVLLVIIAIALAVPYGVVWLLDRAGVVPLGRTLAVLMSWQFLVPSTVVLVAVAIVVGRRK